MATVEAIAARRYREAVRLQGVTTRAASALWKKLDANDLDRSWLRIAPLLLTYVTEAQRKAASGADDYVSAALAAQGLDAPSEGAVNAAALAGVASDGRRLDTLLYSPITTARAAWAGGASTAQGMRSGLMAMQMIVNTQIADAGRVGDGIAIAARPKVTGYVRMLSPPSCARCAILAGKFYRWNAGFQRHPNCDCRHIPASEDNADDLRTDPRKAIEAGQVTGLSRDEMQAILDGADPGQVVNARRGMRTVEIGGRRVQVTSEGTTKRGWSAHVRRRIDELEGRRTEYTETIGGRRGYIKHYSTRRTKPRLTPGEIYKVAKTREEAIRLLARNGYLLDIPGQTDTLIRDLARFASN